MSQPAYVCGTAGCPREGQPTRARRCEACGMAKRATAATRGASYGQAQARGPAHLRASNGLPGLVGMGWKLAVTAAAIGALTDLGLRVLFRTRLSRHGDRIQIGPYPDRDPGSQVRPSPEYQHVQGLPRRVW
jgi:hypothetical protein